MAKAYIFVGGHAARERREVRDGEQKTPVHWFDPVPLSHAFNSIMTGSETVKTHHEIYRKEAIQFSSEMDDRIEFYVLDGETAREAVERVFDFYATARTISDYTMDQLIDELERRHREYMVDHPRDLERHDD